MMAPTFAELRRLSDEELITRHDQLVQHVVPGVNYFLAEMERRDTERANAQMLQFTKQVTRMTAVILALTVVNVVLVAVQIVRG